MKRVTLICLNCLTTLYSFRFRCMMSCKAQMMRIIVIFHCHGYRAISIYALYGIIGSLSFVFSWAEV